MRSGWAVVPALVVAGAASAAPRVWFPPAEGAEAEVVRQLAGAHRTVDVAMFAFTSRPLARALEAAAGRGVRVRVVLDRSQARGRFAEAADLAHRGLAPRLATGADGRGIMHDKFAVVDGRVLLTGSFNWTHQAQATNHENLLELDDAALVHRYEAEFERLYQHAAAGGVAEVPPHHARHRRPHRTGPEAPPPDGAPPADAAPAAAGEEPVPPR